MLLYVKVVGLGLCLWLLGCLAALALLASCGCSSVSTLSDLASAIKILRELGFI